MRRIAVISGSLGILLAVAPARADDIEVRDGCQACPWHGRELPPVAVLDLETEAPTAATRWHQLEVVDEAVHVTVTPPG